MDIRAIWLDGLYPNPRRVVGKAGRLPTHHYAGQPHELLKSQSHRYVATEKGERVARSETGHSSSILEDRPPKGVDLF